MGIKYAKWPYNIRNGHSKTSQNSDILVSTQNPDFTYVENPEEAQRDNL
jgi:hypothetical protein